MSVTSDRSTPQPHAKASGHRLSAGVTEAQQRMLRDKARFIRQETIRLISIAKTGHYASTFSCAEILACLYYAVMNLRRGDPTWADRDRFVIGKGHAAVGIYPVLADLEFLDPQILDTYTRLGNPLGDHPDMTTVPGIDFSSGTLGHALSTSLGMALAARVAHKDYTTFALLGDGELHEGQIWEAAACASHYQLSRLVAIVDRNEFSLDGRVDDIIAIEPLADRWTAFGWDVHEVDGHDVRALSDLLLALKKRGDQRRPAVVIAHTVKGKGVGFMEREFGWHLGWLDHQDEAEAMKELGTAD